MTHWYAVYTKPRKEALAEENLRRQGFEVYYPRIKQERRRNRRWHSVIEALFPRYLFVHLAVGKDNFTPIRSTLGVIDLVRFGGMPKAVPQDLIEAIKAREDRELCIHINRPQWQQGDEVEVTEGPFSGFKGIFQAENGEQRAIILLQLMGRDNKITVDRNVLVPA